MGIITDILKEVPLSAVYRERLVDQEKKMAVLESENMILKSENKVLKSENTNLRVKLQQIQEKQAVQGDICPYCHQSQGQLMGLTPHKIFGDIGVKVGFYNCTNCGKQYDKDHEQ